MTVATEWKTLGLPGKPILRNNGEADSELSPDNIILGLDGKVILSTGHYLALNQAAEMLSNHIGREICRVWFDRGHYEFTGTYGFTVMPEFPYRPLTLPERAAVAAIADYFSCYNAGLRLDQSVSFPFVVRNTNDAESLRHYVQPNFMSEERAYQLADICREVFFLEPEVIRDVNGWLVKVSCDGSESLDAEHMAELRGVCRVLDRYGLVQAKRNIEFEDGEESPIRHAWRRNRIEAQRQRNEAIANTLLKIELAVEKLSNSLTPTKAIGRSRAKKAS